ncbi:hypothetical protein EMIT0P4_20215 [Pseudomonas sp. IT-P4]
MCIRARDHTGTGGFLNNLSPVFFTDGANNRKIGTSPALIQAQDNAMSIQLAFKAKTAEPEPLPPVRPTRLRQLQARSRSYR